jgi:hypothetical protein
MMYDGGRKHKERNVMLHNKYFWLVAGVVSVLAWKGCPNATVNTVGFVGTLVSVGMFVWTAMDNCCKK